MNDHSANSDFWKCGDSWVLAGMDLQRDGQMGAMKRWIKEVDDKMLTFFERPIPRHTAQQALWLLTHVEQAFFLPFKLFIGPAAWVLERHARRVQKTREKVRKGGGFS